MASTWFLFSTIFLVSTMVLFQISCAQELESDDDPSQSATMGPPSSKPRFNRFNRWMTTVKDFFKDGNWLNGGPDNLMEYLTKTLAKLFSILMERSQNAESMVKGLFNSAGGQGGGELNTNGPSRRQPSNQAEQAKTTLIDLLKMIPAEDFANLNGNDARH